MSRGHIGILGIGIAITIMAQMIFPISANPDAGAMDYEDCQQVNDSLLIYSFANYSIKTPYLEKNYTFKWRWASDAPNTPAVNFLLFDPDGIVLEGHHLIKEDLGEFVVMVPGMYKFSWANPSQWNDVTIYYDLDICHIERSMFPFPESQLWNAIGWIAVIVVLIIVVLYIRKIRKRTMEKNKPF